MDLPVIGEQSFVYQFQQDESDEIPGASDVDVAEWDKEKEVNYIVQSQSVYQDYQVLKHLKDIEKLLISKNQIIKNLEDCIKNHRRSLELAEVVKVEVQLAKIRRELSDEVLNEKLNILKNALKSELVYQTNSTRIFELKGWIINIREFQFKWALSPKYKVLKQVENVGKAVVGGVEVGANVTASKISKVGASIKESCPSYTDISEWSIETLGQMSDTVPFLKHYFPKPQELEEKKPEAETKKPRVEAIDEVEAIDGEGE